VTQFTELPLHYQRMESGPITTGDPPEKLDILVDRRLAEANLFLFGIYLP
jgi:hypothetical protein